MPFENFDALYHGYVENEFRKVMMATVCDKFYSGASATDLRSLGSNRSLESNPRRTLTASFFGPWICKDGANLPNP
eukprot:230148-Hanusia_phi.AAC.1